MAAAPVCAMFSGKIRQRISRAHPERFASTVCAMPASAPALMGHIMPQIMESYTTAVDPIWMVVLQLKQVPPGKSVEFLVYVARCLQLVVRGAFHDFMQKIKIIKILH